MSKMCMRVAYEKSDVDKILTEAARAEAKVIGGSSAVHWNDEGDEAVVEFTRCAGNKDVEKERDFGPPPEALPAALVR